MDSNLLCKGPAVIEIEDDVIDLDDTEKTPEEVIYEWDAKIRKTLIADNEVVLENLMKNYLESLEDIVPLYEDNESLRKKIFCHINFIHSYFMELDCYHTENYLNIMEDIITVYCNLEFNILRSPTQSAKIRRATFIAKRIIYVIRIFLLDRNDRCLHVLMKMSPIDASLDKCAAAVNIIFTHFLTNLPIPNLNDDTFCRYYILFQRWKKTTKQNWRDMDTYMYSSFKRTPDSLKNSDILRTVLFPSSQNTVDIVLSLFRCYSDMSKAYFSYMAKRKSVDNSIDIDLHLNLDDDDVVCRATSDDDEDEVKFTESFKNFEKDLTNLSSRKIDSEFDPFLKCKEECDDDDDVVFVGVFMKPPDKPTLLLPEMSFPAIADPPPMPFSSQSTPVENETATSSSLPRINILNGASRVLGQHMEETGAQILIQGEKDQSAESSEIALNLENEGNKEKEVDDSLTSVAVTEKEMNEAGTSNIFVNEKEVTELSTSATTSAEITEREPNQSVIPNISIAENEMNESEETATNIAAVMEEQVNESSTEATSLPIPAKETDPNESTTEVLARTVVNMIMPSEKTIASKNDVSPDLSNNSMNNFNRILSLGISEEISSTIKDELFKLTKTMAAKIMQENNLLKATSTTTNSISLSNNDLQPAPITSTSPAIQPSIETSDSSTLEIVQNGIASSPDTTIDNRKETTPEVPHSPPTTKDSTINNHLLSELPAATNNVANVQIVNVSGQTCVFDKFGQPTPPTIACDESHNNSRSENYVYIAMNTNENDIYGKKTNLAVEQMEENNELYNGNGYTPPADPSDEEHQLDGCDYNLQYTQDGDKKLDDDDDHDEQVANMSANEDDLIEEDCAGSDGSNERTSLSDNSEIISKLTVENEEKSSLIKNNLKIDTGQSTKLGDSNNVLVKMPRAKPITFNTDQTKDENHKNLRFNVIPSSTITNRVNGDTNIKTPKVIYSRAPSANDLGKISNIESWNELNENKEFDDILTGPVEKMIPLTSRSPSPPRPSSQLTNNSRPNSPGSIKSPNFQAENKEQFASHYKKVLNGGVTICNSILKKTNNNYNCYKLSRYTHKLLTSFGGLQDVSVNLVHIPKLNEEILNNKWRIRVDYDKSDSNENILHYKLPRITMLASEVDKSIGNVFDSNVSDKNDELAISYELSQEFGKLKCEDGGLADETDNALNLTIPETKPVNPESEFSNSPTFLPDSERLNVEECLNKTKEDDQQAINIEIANCKFLSNNSNFYKLACNNSNNNNTSSSNKNDSNVNSIQLPTAVPDSYDFDKNVKNEIFSKIDISNLDDSDSETRLPLKKRKKSVANKNEENEEVLPAAKKTKKEEEISYPATKMMSIAELEAQLQSLKNSQTSPTSRPSFKTPAQRKEMPPLPSAQSSNNYLNVESEPSPIITDQYNINNHTYNNATINYHMNNVPVPFINIPCGSYYSIPPILVPFNNITSFDQNKINVRQRQQQQQHTYQQPHEVIVKKETTRRGRHPKVRIHSPFEVIKSSQAEKRKNNVSAKSISEPVKKRPRVSRTTKKKHLEEEPMKSPSTPKKRQRGRKASVTEPLLKTKVEMATNSHSKTLPSESYTHEPFRIDLSNNI